MSDDRRQSDTKYTVAESSHSLRDLMHGGKRAGFILIAGVQLVVVIAGLVAFWTGGIDPLVFGALLVSILALLTAGQIYFRSSFRAHDESSRRLRLLAEMNVEVNREVLLNEDIELIYRTILDYLFRIFDKVTSGSILILGDDGYLSFAASRGFPEDYVKRFRLRLEDSFLYQSTEGQIKETRLFSQGDFARLVTIFQPGDWEFTSVISAPLFVGDRLFGTLNLDSDRSGIFDADDVAIVERFRAQIEVCLLARERYRSNIERYHVDSLTGLFTRRYFEDLFSVSLERALRHKEAFVVALFDADGLKYANDTLGHLAGDQVLLSIASALRASCRKSDIMGRFGGDEFIALYHVSETETIEKNIANILTTIRARPMSYSGKEFRLSFSYGLASYPKDGTDLDSLTAVADKRLYAMKSQHKSM